MKLRARFSLLTLFLLHLILALAMAFWWWWPKSQPLSLNKDIYTGYYRGLGLTNEKTFVGKTFYRLVAQDGDYGYWEVNYLEPGYNSYRGFYSNGICREKGECFVETNGDMEDPAPDNCDVRLGKYYKPDGSLGSEIVNGTGTQTYWYLNGKKRWELVLRDYIRQRHSIWFENGQLNCTQQYVDGKVDGEFKAFYKNGTIQIQGEYTKGDRTGTWTRFDNNGKVITIEDHSMSSATISRE